MTTKELATKIAIEVITDVARQDLTGEEKKDKVCAFLAKLDDNLPLAGFIPNAIEAEIIEVGIEKVQEFFAKVDIPAFVEKTYGRIKHLLKKLFHRA